MLSSMTDLRLLLVRAAALRGVEPEVVRAELVAAAQAATTHHFDPRLTMETGFNPERGLLEVCVTIRVVQGEPAAAGFRFVGCGLWPAIRDVVSRVLHLPDESPPEALSVLLVLAALPPERWAGVRQLRLRRSKAGLVLKRRLQVGGTDPDAITWNEAWALGRGDVPEGAFVEQFEEQVEASRVHAGLAEPMVWDAAAARGVKDLAALANQLGLGGRKTKLSRSRFAALLPLIPHEADTRYIPREVDSGRSFS